MFCFSLKTHILNYCMHDQATSKQRIHKCLYGKSGRDNMTKVSHFIKNVDECFFVRSNVLTTLLLATLGIS